MFCVCFDCRVLDVSRWRRELDRWAKQAGCETLRIYDEADGSSLVVADHRDLKGAETCRAGLADWPFAWAKPDGLGPFLLRQAHS